MGIPPTAATVSPAASNFILLDVGRGDPWPPGIHGCLRARRFRCLAPAAVSTVISHATRRYPAGRTPQGTGLRCRILPTCCVRMKRRMRRGCTRSGVPESPCSSIAF